MMEGSDYPQSAASPQSMDSVLTSEGKTILLQVWMICIGAEKKATLLSFVHLSPAANQFILHSE